MSRLIIFILGIGIVYFTITSVIRTFILPRAAREPLTTIIFLITRTLFNIFAKFSKSYYQKDKILALFAPVTLLVLPPIWLTLITIGYTLMFWATGIDDFVTAFTISGSSILTLGFEKGTTVIHTILSFTAAMIGLGLVALLIAYLPTIYSEFAKREVSVNQLTVRAGDPPSPVEMLLRFHRLERLNKLGPLWEHWETWFVEIEESHTSFSILAFFRSPLADHSWVNAAGTIMDAAALRLAVLDLPDDINTPLLPDGRIVPGDPGAAIMIRAGFLALRRIADVYGITHNSNPHFPKDQISLTEEEFYQACTLFAEQGLPIKKELDQAWIDFAGWRVNYDSVLIGLQNITYAIPAPWIRENLST